jgi:hypothetical protein
LVKVYNTLFGLISFKLADACVFSYQGQQLFSLYLFSSMQNANVTHTIYKVAEDSYELLRPYDCSARIPSVSPTDTGAVVDAILKGGKTYYGKTVAIYSEWISDKEKLQTWAESKLRESKFDVLLKTVILKSDYCRLRG